MYESFGKSNTAKIDEYVKSDAQQLFVRRLDKNITSPDSASLNLKFYLNTTSLRKKKKQKTKTKTKTRNKRLS